MRLTRVPRLLAVSALGFVAACPDEGGDDHLSTSCPMVTTQADCDEAEGCIWDPDHTDCVVDCATIDERSACLDEDACFWDGQDCFYGAL